MAKQKRTVSRDAFEQVMWERDVAIDQLKQLGYSLGEKPKTGHWIDTGSGQMCSRCGEIQYGYDSFRRFCASCGAKMVKPQESEE